MAKVKNLKEIRQRNQSIREIKNLFIRIKKQKGPFLVSKVWLDEIQDREL